jgi:hypothetical protein
MENNKVQLLNLFYVCEHLEIEKFARLRQLLYVPEYVWNVREDGTIFPRCNYE